MGITQVLAALFLVLAATSPADYQDSNTVPANGWTRTETLPSGTEVFIRTAAAINVQQAGHSEQFPASVERDVFDAKGQVIIPKGASAHLIAHDLGGGELAIDLRSVSVHGQRYILNDNDINRGPTPRPGAPTDRMPLLGTILGAVGGDGRAAAIDVLPGGTAGQGSEVLTRGHELRIPAHTLLRFLLDRPVYVYR